MLQLGKGCDCMKLLKLAVTLLVSTLGIAFGVFVYRRVFFENELKDLLRTGPVDLTGELYFPHNFNEFFLSFIVVSIFGTMFVSAIIYFLFHRRSKFSNYKHDSSLRNNRFPFE